ncbi:MAG: hypothetical protein ACLQBD_00715, partial [Syntrophobacteraceae bacterium]
MRPFEPKKVLVGHEEDKAHENISLRRSSAMIFLRALRVSFVLLSRIFLFFEQDFVYKLLFSQRSLRLCGELLFVF